MTESLRETCAALAPRDGLEDAIRAGESLSPQERAEASARFERVVKAAVAVAPYANTPPARVELAQEWLAAKRGKDRDAVADVAGKAYRKECTRPIRFSDGTHYRPDHGIAGDRAGAYLLLALHAKSPSSAASYLREVAYAAARTQEAEKRVPGGTAHAGLIGLIRGAAAQVG